MKILAVIFIALISLSMEGVGQFRETPSPAIYLAFQPADCGLGIRGDYHLNHWAGVYGSVSYGQWGLYKWSGLGSHVKLTTGILIPWKDWAGNQYDWSVGLNHHLVSGDIISNEIFHQPWSFEVGLTAKMRGFALGLRTDIPRWEPCIDVGIPLNWRRR